MVFDQSFALATSTEFTFTTTSPALSPASAAGLYGSTWRTSRPALPWAPKNSASCGPITSSFAPVYDELMIIVVPRMEWVPLAPVAAFDGGRNELPARGT